jgi:ribokinase
MEINELVAKYAHDKGVPVMLNPAPSAPLSDSLLSNITYISPNEHEAALLAGHEINVENGINFDDVAIVAKAFHDRGVQNLIITMGGNGSVIAGQDGIHHTPCVKMPHVADPTAAGDSFVAAFCTALSAGLPQAQALDFASHTAAITVSRMGAINSLPVLDEVQALMRERNYQGFDAAVLDALREGSK